MMRLFISTISRDLFFHAKYVRVRPCHAPLPPARPSTWGDREMVERQRNLPWAEFYYQISNRSPNRIQLMLNTQSWPVAHTSYKHVYIIIEIRLLQCNTPSSNAWLVFKWLAHQVWQAAKDPTHDLRPRTLPLNTLPQSFFLPTN